MWRADEAFEFEYDSQEFFVEPLPVTVNYTSVYPAFEFQLQPDGSLEQYAPAGPIVRCEITSLDGTWTVTQDKLGPNWAVYCEIDQQQLTDLKNKFVSTGQWYIYGPGLGDPDWSPLPALPDGIRAALNYIAHRYGKPNGLAWSDPASNPMADMIETIKQGYIQASRAIGKGFSQIVSWHDEVSRTFNQEGDRLGRRPQDSRLPPNYGRGHTGPASKSKKEPRPAGCGHAGFTERGFRDARSLARVRSRR